jgi:hypothetical protein
VVVDRCLCEAPDGRPSAREVSAAFASWVTRRA